MSDLTRRNFLRGIVAAVGVAAVGLPTLQAIASEAPPPELPFPDHENGDLFIKVDQVWRFAGKVKSIEQMRDVTIDISHLGSRHREFAAGFIDPTIGLTAFYDKDGCVLLGQAFDTMNRHEFAISRGDHLFMITALIRSMAITGRGDAIEIEATMSPLGPLTIIEALPASVRNRNETGPQFHKKSNKFSDSQSMG